MGCAKKQKRRNSSILCDANCPNDAAFIFAVDQEKEKDESTSRQIEPVLKDDANEIVACGKSTEKNPQYKENNLATVVTEMTDLQSHVQADKSIAPSKGYRRTDEYTETNTTGPSNIKPTVVNNKTVYGGVTMKLKRQEDNGHTCHVCNVLTPTYIVYGDGKKYCYSCFDWNYQCPLYVPIWTAKKCSMPDCRFCEYTTKMYTCNRCNVRNVHKECQKKYWTGASAKPRYYCYDCATDKTI